MTFGGLPIRWEPAGESRGVALVAQGRAYASDAPLLDVARVAEIHLEVARAIERFLAGA